MQNSSSISVLAEVHPELGTNFCFEKDVLSLYPPLL